LYQQPWPNKVKTGELPQAPFLLVDNQNKAQASQAPSLPFYLAVAQFGVMREKVLPLLWPLLAGHKQASVGCEKKAVQLSFESIVDLINLHLPLLAV